jgi:hypothetical protein
MTVNRDGVLVVKRTVNRKGMGGGYESIRWKNTFGFSILWNLKNLWWVFGVQKILLDFTSFLQDNEIVKPKISMRLFIGI